MIGGVEFEESDTDDDVTEDQAHRHPLSTRGRYHRQRHPYVLVYQDS